MAANRTNSELRRLVKDLRSHKCAIEIHDTTPEEAANTIESLQAEVERLEGKARTHQQHSANYRERLDKAEAEVEKLRKAAKVVGRKLEVTRLTQRYEQDGEFASFIDDLITELMEGSS